MQTEEGESLTETQIELSEAQSPQKDPSKSSSLSEREEEETGHLEVSPTPKPTQKEINEPMDTSLHSQGLSTTETRSLGLPDDFQDAEQDQLNQSSDTLYKYSRATNRPIHYGRYLPLFKNEQGYPKYYLPKDCKQ